MSRLVLCISGKRFAGKDTLARLLVRAARDRGIALETYAFAGESKRMFAAARPEVDLTRLVDDRDYKEQWRPQLTQFTVDALAADPLIFVREVMRRIHVSPAFPLITDLRLRLELEHLRKVSQPYVMRVTRSDAHRTASGWRYDQGKDTHYTEVDLDDASLWNEVIVNDADEAALGRLADDVIKRVLI